MKITSLQENLKSGLVAVSHIAGKNVNLPILNNVLIEAKDGNIRLVTTDLEIGIVANIRGKVDKEGAFTVDARVITDFISLMPNQKIELELKSAELYLLSDNHQTTIKGQGPDDFPLIPQIDKQNGFKIDADLFRKALQQVVFAVSTSNTRMELSGVLFKISGNGLTLAATDSYRLAEKKIKITNSSQVEIKTIVPSKTLQEVVRLLGNLKKEEVSTQESEISFYFSENQVLFSIGTIELVSRLIEGQYPEYEQIIPIKNNTKINCERPQILRAVKAASIFSKNGINDINLDFPAGKNKIVISSTSSSVGENVSEVDAIVNGIDNGIVVNYRFLLDAFNNIESERVNLEVIDGATPCLLRPEKDDSYLYVIMPIKQ